MLLLDNLLDQQPTAATLDADTHLFNHQRLLSSIGHVPPVEYEEQLNTYHTPREGEIVLT